MKQFIQRLETGKVRVRTGSEPAAKAVLGDAVNALWAKVIPELAPKHSGPSNPAGAAVKIPESQTRVLKPNLEKRCDVRVAASMPTWPRLMRLAGRLRARRDALEAGLHASARRELRARATSDFGETVLYRVPRPAR